MKDQQPQQQSAEEFKARSLKDEVKRNFMAAFGSLEHQYKMHIHLCQYKAYKENTDLSKAETASQECFKPYLIMHRHIQAAFSQDEEKFEDCV